MKYIPNAREEIDQEVLRDFVKQLEDQGRVEYSQLAKKYTEFKNEWKNNMI